MHEQLPEWQCWCMGWHDNFEGGSDITDTDVEIVDNSDRSSYTRTFRVSSRLTRNSGLLRSKLLLTTEKKRQHHLDQMFSCAMIAVT